MATNVRLCRSKRCTDAECAPAGGLRGATEGALLCTACRDLVVSDLNSLAGLYQACEQVLGGTGQRQEKVSGRRTFGIPLNTAAADARESIRRTLAAWSALVVDERAVTGPDLEVRALVRFLLRHVDWLCTHPAANNLADEIADSVMTARRAAFPASARTFRVGPCVQPDCSGQLSATVRSLDSLLPSEVTCDADSTHTWPAHRWRELGRRADVDHTTAEQWFTAKDVAVYWNISASNVYRLASENKWRRRTSGGRVFYLGDDVARTVR